MELQLSKREKKKMTQYKNRSRPEGQLGQSVQTG